ncbi:putative PKS/NRPS-like protein biosynthetic cluster [Arthroderma sp. PD_2]|nr:putative PKS/NRPS-like protein biosynthetic cluster [Arthroderma sp. PD_2]
MHDTVNGAGDQKDNGCSEPIAIIGMACRFSGNVKSPTELWHLLAKGRTGWTSNAGERFKMNAFWHPKAETSGSFNCQGLHLIQQDPGHFDNDFFGINGLEAMAMDPQHRLLLEVAYETFENAGVTLEELEGSNTGVYCAPGPHDYDIMLGRDPEASPRYRFTGTGPSFVANRISYVFDLKGPSMAIDTACASSHYAIHSACRALRDGDIDQALVGGANMILDPDKICAISSMNVNSDHGRCYIFDEKAAGYGRGEGVAAIMLKTLKAAMRDGDPVHAVIRGSSVSADGKTPGITSPSLDAYLKNIWGAYKQAGLDPKDTLFVEAHGTSPI